MGDIVNSTLAPVFTDAADFNMAVTAVPRPAARQIERFPMKTLAAHLSYMARAYDKQNNYTACAQLMTTEPGASGYIRHSIRIASKQALRNKAQILLLTNTACSV